MDYAVVLYMNDEKTAMVRKMIGRLAPACGSDYCLGIVPHITVPAIVADNGRRGTENAVRMERYGQPDGCRSERNGRGYAMREIIKRYFQAWLDADPQPLGEIFSENIIYSECYGPEYRGLPQILRWFEDWNRRGAVLEWTVKRVIEHDRTVVAEWYFKCEYDGNTDGFDGVTVADFDKDGRIEKLSEFQSKAEHYYPYGE